jgi:hypothetical protein
MYEVYGAMDHEKKMSRRDRARADFVRNFKIKQLKKSTLKNQVIAERERIMDIQETIKYQTRKSIKEMHYDELLETLNKNT